MAVDSTTYHHIEDEGELVVTYMHDLRKENAALWRFVRAEDAFNRLADSPDWDEDDAAYHAMLAAREALRPYETGGDR